MKSKLIVCPFSMQNSLLALYRKDNPFCNIKCLTKQELLNHKYGHYSQKAISYLMINENCTYENARILLKYIRFVLEDNPDHKIHKLFNLRNTLIENNLLILNPYYSNLYLNKEIEVYGYSPKDRELSNCFDGIDAKFHLNSLQKCGGTVDRSQTLDNEIYYVLNSIAQLIDDEIDINNIFILCKDELALYYIQKHADSFHFKVNFEMGNEVFTLGIVTDFLNKYKETKNIDDSIIYLKTINSEYTDELVTLIKENIIMEFTFEQQLDYLINVFKKHHVTPLKYDKAVTVISESVLRKGAHVFVPCFVQGQYPEAFKDNEYLNDICLEKLQLNTSLINGEINEDIYLSFFSDADINFYYSYSDHSYKEVYYTSPWCSKLDLVPIERTLTPNIYSEDFAYFLSGKALDLKRLYREITTELASFGLQDDVYDFYQGYDNVVNQIDAYDKDSVLYHSYSSIKNYYECPFKYYLSNVLKLDPFEGNYKSNRGLVAHEVFERCFRDDVDFEQAYTDAKNKIEWSPRDEVLLEAFKPHIKLAYEGIKLHKEKYMNEHVEFYEDSFTVQIEPKAYLRVRIDKTIIVEDKYLYIIDYKTGSESFEKELVPLGISLQLPTYAHAASLSDKYKNYDLCGLYIQGITDKALTIEIGKDDIIPDYLKLNGISLADKDVITKFDNSLESNTSKFIRSFKINAKGGLDSRTKCCSKAEILSYGETAKNLYMDANFKIRQNEFPIEPKVIENKHDSCDYCPFKDICYVTASDKVYISKKDLDDGGSNNGN